MKTMKTMKHLERTAESICFVGIWLNKTNTLGAGNREKASYPFICFMFSEFVHTFLAWLSKNMKVMKIYEARFIKGIYLPCFIWRGSPSQKHEANMKKYEEVGMKRNLIYLILAMLVLTGCGAPVVQAAEAGTPAVQRSLTPAATATATVSPTPTVGWQATAVAAQATADEAMRIDTASTAAEKERVQVQLGWTAQADLWTAQSNQATATAYGTSVPLTSTARVENMTATSAYMTLTSNQMTATEHAPTQVVAMIDAQNYEEYGALDFIIRLFVLAGLGVFLFGVGIFALFNKPMGMGKPVKQPVAPAQKDPDLIPLKQQGTVVKYTTNNGQGWGKDLLYKIPCSHEQLSELADRVINKNETLGVNRWEGEKSLLTRAVILRMRNFFVVNKLAVSSGAGRVALNDAGLTFLRDWLESNALPHSYSFVPVDDGAPLNMSHDAVAHDAVGGGG